MSKTTTEPPAPDPVPEVPGELVPMTDRDILVRMLGAFEKLTERLAQPNSSASESSHLANLITTLSTAMERVSQSSLEGAKLMAEESRKAHRPSNQVVPNRSVFNQRGENRPDGSSKPRLKCTMMIPWLVENESATREEVELLNLLEPGMYSLRRNDGTKVSLTVTVETKADMKTPSRLVMNHETAFNNDNFKMMPPLTDMLRQLLKQHPKSIASAANAILSEDEETALIEAGDLAVSV